MKRRGFLATLLAGAVATVLPWKAKADEKVVPKPQADKFEGDPEIFIDEQCREVALWQDDGYCYAIDNKGQLFRSSDSFNWRKVND
jgi:hypothetical protein